MLAIGKVVTIQHNENIGNFHFAHSFVHCVYHCDNDVCDHQVTVLEFDNGVTATFNLSAFTDRIARTLKIMGEDGELRASEEMNTIEVIPFSSNAQAKAEIRTIHPALAASGHSGGDAGIVDSFLKMLEAGGGETATDISRSVESHLMACAAEEARVTGAVVDIAGFRRRHEGGAGA